MSSAVESVLEKNYEISRWCELNDESNLDDLSQIGVHFTAEESSFTSINSKAINLYNEGCPVEEWGIATEKRERTRLKVFQTGDPFTIVSQDVLISGSNINIHCGLWHESFSQIVLIQEALQLCRCAHEHGARSITITLPQVLHPLLNPNDFNALLLELLKVSGVNRIYYYDRSFSGNLDEAELPSSVLTNDLMLPTQTDNTKLDLQVMRLMRRFIFKDLCNKFLPHDKDRVYERLARDESTSIEVSDSSIKPHILLCGNANKALAESIAESLRLRGERVKLYQIDGKGIAVQIPEEAELCGARVSIIQCTRPSPENVAESAYYETNGGMHYFYETLLMARMAHLRGAIKINLINPYQFNARSDKAEDSSNGKTGAYVQHNGQLLSAAGVNEVITAECHDVHTLSGAYTNESIRGSVIAGLSVIAARLADFWLHSPECSLEGQLRLVTPDAGAAKRTKELTLQLKDLLGKKLCNQRVLGEKNRNSHRDNSALISALNSGDVAINARDKYLITDDETATGSTLCQAIIKLREGGALDISVIVVHNNLPLNWLDRQLCLARFLFIGANDIHFSDTNEMGTLAEHYDDLLASAEAKFSLRREELEQKVFEWFKKNVIAKFGDQTSEYGEDFERFKNVFSSLKDKISVHSLALEFANKVKTKPYYTNPNAFVLKVDDLVSKIQESSVGRIIAFKGSNLPAAAAVASYLNLPLTVLSHESERSFDEILRSVHTPFALVSSGEKNIIRVLSEIEADVHDDRELAFINCSARHSVIEPVELSFLKEPAVIADALSQIEEMYQEITATDKLKKHPIKLIGIGLSGQCLAGQLVYQLKKRGIEVGMTLVDDDSLTNQLSFEKDSINVKDVCISIAESFTEEMLALSHQLISEAKAYHYANYSINDGHRSNLSVKAEPCSPPRTSVYASEVQGLFFMERMKISQPRQASEQLKKNTTNAEVKLAV